VLVARRDHGARDEAGVGTEHHQAVRKAELAVVRIVSRFDEVPHAGDAVDREQSDGRQRGVSTLESAVDGLSAIQLVAKFLPDDDLGAEQRKRGVARVLVNLRAHFVGVAVIDRDRMERGCGETGTGCAG
jgi:hypothetical protein